MTLLSADDLDLSAVVDGPLGVAVSGGGDSMALLCLLSDWARASNRILHVATVNHNLRPEAVAEATQVQNLCQTLGWSHEVLNWTGWQGQGNLQNQARDARRQLLAAWAERKHVLMVAMGHTIEDQAETFVMRLARGSGVDGLSGMASSEVRDGVHWLRPMLGLKRADLRVFLKERRVEWAEDPSNGDVRFDRVKVRQHVNALNMLGLTSERLSKTAETMRRARHALERTTLELAVDVATPTLAGSVVIERGGLLAAPVEVQLRVVSHALSWVSGQAYRPRLASLQKVLDKVLAGETRTLHGCVLVAQKQGFEVCREQGAATGGNPFDGRWSVQRDDMKVLGPNGLAQVPSWRDSPFSRTSLLATPSRWQGNTLLAAPVLNFGPERAELCGGVQSFFRTLLSH